MEFLARLAIAFEHGGFWMWPIALFQILSLAIIIERVWALFLKRSADQLAQVSAFEDDIRRGQIDAVYARAAAGSAAQPIARAVAAGALAAGRFGGREEIQAKMDEVLLAENSVLDRRTGFLSMLGNVATLTGLLGTITGMIKSFGAVANASPSEKATLLAQGISEAMNATAYGLITAIPALVLYAVLQNRSNHLADDLNQAALKAFNWLSFAYESVGSAAARKFATRDETARQRDANA